MMIHKLFQCFCQFRMVIDIRIHEHEFCVLNRNTYRLSVPKCDVDARFFRGRDLIQDRRLFRTNDLKGVVGDGS